VASPPEPVGGASQRAGRVLLSLMLAAIVLVLAGLSGLAPRPLLILGLALIPSAPLIALLVIALALPRHDRRLARFALGGLAVTLVGIAIALAHR